MTEFETLQRAKTYIEKLANGINPLDDTIIPENDIVNNIRISRCFFYVSDILRQVIENGGISKASKTKKLPFDISIENLLEFNFSTTGIPISEITKRINLLVDIERYNKISYNQITSWLIRIGILEEQTDKTGKSVKRPTKSGEELGIYVEQRMGTRGQYTVVLYNLEAQHFIIDNIEAIKEAYSCE